ncbi:MAG: winged helix-turn-helix domain-containing protein [archaeon]
MVKRNRVEIIRDILKIVQENNNSIKHTPLLRSSNLSSQRFSEYLKELVSKGFLEKVKDKRGKKYITITPKGSEYLRKYNIVVSFIDEFDL